jgi:hypothetical protein
MTLASELRSYEDPVEKMADTAARVMKRYNSRRVQVVPKGTGGAGFNVLLDGAVVATINKSNHDEAKVREKIEARLCR